MPCMLQVVGLDGRSISDFSHLTFQQKGNCSSQASKSIKTEHFYYTNFPLDGQTRQAFGL